LCCFSITLPKFQHVSTALDWLPIEYGEIPRQTGIRRLGPAIEALSAPLFRQLGRMRSNAALIDRAVAMGRMHRVEVVWVVACHPTAIQIATSVAQRLGARLALMLWDPPELMTQSLHYDRLSVRATMTAFQGLLAAADRATTASEAMKAAYKAQYGLDSQVLIFTPDDSLRKMASTALKQPDRVLIGFSGSLYAKVEWEAFLRALEATDWQIGGRAVTVRFLGNNVALRARKRASIEFLGWHPEADTIELMASCDIAYLPYWMDSAHRTAVQMCFPNKLAAYMVAGLPVFFHGPADSSPAHFLRRFPAGVVCASLEPNSILESLQTLVCDETAYSRAALATQRALDDELNRDIFLERFAWMLRISTSDLL
jgi:hypothetical protein